MKKEQEFLRSSFLASSLSTSANKEPCGFPRKLLLLPQIPSGVKESLHLRSHGPVPRRKPKQQPIRRRQMPGRNLRYGVVFGRRPHLIQHPNRQCLRNPIQKPFHTFHAIHASLQPLRQPLHVSVHRIEHDEDLQFGSAGDRRQIRRRFPSRLVGRKRGRLGGVRRSFVGGRRGLFLAGNTAATFTHYGRIGNVECKLKREFW